MMLRNLVIAAIAAMLPMAAGALTLTINGEPFAVDSVDVSTSASGVKITTNPVIDLGTGGDGAGAGAGGGDGGGDGGGGGDGTGGGGGTGGGASCGAVPAGVTLATPIEKWHAPGGQTRNALGSKTKSFEFTTTSNPAYAGQVGTTHTTTNPTTRTVWISECPGAPISSVAPECVNDGKEGVVVRWAQNPDARTCALQTNKTYYINIKNAAKNNPAISTCTSNNCPFFMVIYTNQQP